MDFAVTMNLVLAFGRLADLHLKMDRRLAADWADLAEIEFEMIALEWHFHCALVAAVAEKQQNDK